MSSTTAAPEREAPSAAEEEHVAKLSCTPWRRHVVKAEVLYETEKYRVTVLTHTWKGDLACIAMGVVCSPFFLFGLPCLLGGLGLGHNPDVYEYVYENLVQNLRHAEWADVNDIHYENIQHNINYRHEIFSLDNDKLFTTATWQRIWGIGERDLRIIWCNEANKDLKAFVDLIRK